MSSIKLTELEKLALENIVINDYGCAPQHSIWSWAIVDCGINEIDKNKISGVVSSLVKKGLVEKGYDVEDAFIELTKEGSKVVYELLSDKHDWMKKYKDEYNYA